MLDLLIRAGKVIDGSGAAAFYADVGIRDGVIVEIGDLAGAAAREVVDAGGMIVTPGFVDIHTHYDAQALWSDRLTPSSHHGVTTAVVGNCGVGFAPCRSADRDVLIEVMEGVEDIPGAVMAEGLPWNWETFPQFLDALASNRRDIDIAAYFPHTPLRVFVMGERGIRHEPATADDLVLFRRLAMEGAKAGALGFSTSRFEQHRTAGGDMIPSYKAGLPELDAILEGFHAGGGALVQAIVDYPRETYAQGLDPLVALARTHRQVLTFTLASRNNGPQEWPHVLGMLDKWNEDGVRVIAQVSPRPVGILMGLRLTWHPFRDGATFRKIAHLPLTQLVAEMRKPDIRRAILQDAPDWHHPFGAATRDWDWIFRFDNDFSYEPARGESVGAQVRAMRIEPLEFVYDLLLEQEGEALLLKIMANFEDFSLNSVSHMLAHPHVLPTLGDGGAHYATLCDAGYTTHMLAHWSRDRTEGRFSLEQTVKSLSRDPAMAVGLTDRGVIARGMKADLNVIDHDKLRLRPYSIEKDLPGGGKRIEQLAHGFVATAVSGRLIIRNDAFTGALPGALARRR